MVSVEGVPGAIDAGTKPQENPAGSVEHERLTFAAKVPTAATFTVVVLLEFWLTVMGEPAERVKSCPLMTSTVCVCVMPPPEDCTVKFTGPSGVLVVVSVSVELAPAPVGATEVGAKTQLHPAGSGFGPVAGQERALEVAKP